MPTSTNEQPLEIQDLSGGIQRKTTKFLQSTNQVNLAVNADFSRLGGVQKIAGYEQVGNAVTTTSTSTTSSTSSTTSSTSSTTSTTSTSSSSTSTSSSTSSSTSTSTSSSSTTT